MRQLRCFIGFINPMFTNMTSKEQLKLIMPNAPDHNIERLCQPLNDTMDKFLINTPQRICCFLAQIAHESGQLNYLHELWGPTSIQLFYERDFDHAWPPTKDDPRNNSAYSLGNDEVGDGERFKGRGLIEVTGKKNYQITSKGLGVDFVKNPELLEGPVYATMSAGLFWMNNRINVMADSGDFDGVSDLVNFGHKTYRVGDTIGYAERLTFYERAKQVICPA